MIHASGVEVVPLAPRGEGSGAGLLKAPCPLIPADFGAGPCALMDRLGRAEVERVVRPALDAYAIEPPKVLARVGALLG